MRDEKLSVLIDVGGQSCRAVIVDTHGRWLAHASRAASARAGNGTDAEALACDVEQALTKAVSELGSRRAHLCSAGLAIERGSVVCWDRISAQPLTPVLSWQDRRGSDLVSQSSDMRQQVKAKNGLRMTPYGGATKLKWCLEQVPAVAEALQRGRLGWGPLGSFLAFRLLKGRPFLVDDSLAQRTLLWSRHTLDWDEELLDLFGLPGGCLPAVVPSGHRFGYLAAVDPSVPLDLIIGDQNAVPFANRSDDPDTFFINLGTGAFLLRPVDKPPETDIFQLSLLSRESGGRFALEASIHGAASALNWLAARSGREMGPDQLDDQKQRGAPPLFLNTIDGLGSPWWTPGPEPGFLNETSSPDNRFEARLMAVLESIAFLIRINFDEINRLVGPPRHVRISGGLSGSATLCQLIADILQQEACRSRNPEATVMGLWQQLDKRPAGTEELQSFRPGKATQLRQRYQRWLAAMPSLPQSG